MQRDPRAYLWDAREAAGAILEFVAGKTFEDYAGDRLLRSAIERQFEIIGEALNQLCKIEQQWAGRIPDVPQIIAFRNVLIHGYASVNDLTVWRTIDESLSTLYETVTSLLDEADTSPTQRDRMD
ncbi:MAG: HepT-like ribonuclease domain-containing protein [Methylobacter sp.]